MKLATKVAYNTIIQIISKIISTILGLVAVAVMTRYLGQFGFGQYTTIMTFLSFFGIAADLGLTLVTVQMISRLNTDETKTIGNLFALRLVSAILFLGLAPLIVFFFPYDLSIKIGVMITTLSFFFIALNQIFVGLFQKKLRMDKVAIAEVASRLVLVSGVGLVAYYHWSLTGMMIATVGASLTSFIFHYIFSLKFVRLRLYFDRAIWLVILKQSWPIAITIIFNLIYLKADTLILSLIKSQEEVGIYGAAYKVIDVLVTIPFMFAGITLPILTTAWASGDKDRFAKILQRSFDAMIILAVPMVIGAQLLATDLMTLVAGKDFTVSGPVLQILILAAGIIFASCIFSHAVIAIDRQKQIISAYVFVSLTALVGYLIFIPRFSYIGAAWVTVYSEFAIALASYLLVRKNSAFRPKIKIIGQAILASLVMAIVIYLVLLFFPGLNILLVGILAAIAYFFALYLFKGITKYDIMELLGRADKENL